MMSNGFITSSPTNYFICTAGKYTIGTMLTKEIKNEKWTERSRRKKYLLKFYILLTTTVRVVYPCVGEK